MAYKRSYGGRKRYRRHGRHATPRFFVFLFIFIILVVALILVMSKLFSKSADDPKVNMPTQDIVSFPSPGSQTSDIGPTLTPDTSPGQQQPTDDGNTTQTAGPLFAYLGQEKWGYKNGAGKVIIDEGFDEAKDFDNGVAFAAKKDGDKLLYGLIDEMGSWIVEPKWNEVSDFSEGIAAVKVISWGYVNSDGIEIVDPIYAEAAPFKDGVAKAKKDDKIGYLKPDGQWQIENTFSAATDFDSNVAAVKKDSANWALIDKDGNEIAAIKCERIGGVAESRAWKVNSDGSFTLIDLEGNNVTDEKFSGATAFSGGFAAVKKSGKWGYIDMNGTMVIEPEFKEVNPFSNGYAAVKKESKWGYIDTNGSVKIEAAYDEAGKFTNGFAKVKKGTELGVIDEFNNYKLLNVVS